MTEPTFTILLPIVRPPVLMPFAIRSILRQTRDDFELFIVCDGAPEETVKAAAEAAGQDGRIRVFPFPKGERRGEAHRHTALQEARGRIVCQLGDDDLWLPNHLEEMEIHLSEFEFGNLLHVSISATVGPSLVLGDLADPAMRDRMNSDDEIFNLFGPSESGYLLDTYRRLPVGWSPAPPGMPTDLYMWRKFLALPEIRAGTRFVLTSLHMGSAARPGWSMERRRDEMAGYVEMITQPGWSDRLLQLALRGTARLETDRRAADDYHRRQSEAWQAEYRQLSTDLLAVRQYLVEVEAARDYHRQRADARQAPHAARLGRFSRKLRRLTRSWRHRG